MNEPNLLQRQRWFRSFPEGTIEFLLVTRILGIFLLLALGVVRESQRPMLILALGIILLIDYVLMIWWGVQMGIDLNDLCGRARESGAAVADRAAGPPPEPRRRGPITALLACLPALMMFEALIPWPELAMRNPVTRAAVVRVMLPMTGVLFLVFLVLGQIALQRIRLGPPVWTLLLLVPPFHWLAMHRLVTHFRARLEQHRRDLGELPAEGPALAVPIADATWVVGVLPWVALAVWGIPQSTSSSFDDLIPPCGAVLAAVFAIADVAAMEGLQRQFAAALRRVGLPPRP